ncbi:MAG: hypothetical protein V1743_00860 [Nanoarchaeota archaeon]
MKARALQRHLSVLIPTLFMLILLLILLASCTTDKTGKAFGKVKNTCFESDEGNDLLWTGRIYGVSGGIRFNLYDTCSGNILTEYFCESGEKKSVEVICEQAYGEEYTCRFSRCEKKVKESLPDIIGLSPDSCKDDDGEYNYTWKGNVSGFKQESRYTFLDYCEDAATIVEHYCYGAAAKEAHILCEELGKSYKCFDGRCVIVQENQSICTDSDGINTTIKGYVTGFYSNGSQYLLFDACTENHRQVLENYCTESPPASGNWLNNQTSLSCTSGCVNGACIVTNNQTLMNNSCADTDNGIIQDEFGIAYGFQNSHFILVFDSCTGSMNQSCENCTSPSLIENYCLGLQLTSTLVNCTAENKSCMFGECS